MMNLFQIAVRIANKFKTSSGSMGNGWWITPEGKVVDVPTGQLHEEVATEILTAKCEFEFNENETAQDKFLDLGAIRIRIYKNFFVVSVKKLTSKILDRVTDLMIDQNISKNFKVIVEETSSGKKVTLPVTEFLNFTNPNALFKAVASIRRKS
jgi:predicted RNA-binding protein with TRAM domain